MATLDDGVQNLQRFVGHLMTAVQALQQTTDHVQECTQDAAQIEDQITQHGGGLNDELEEAEGKLEGDEGAALQALTELAQAATAGQGTLDEKHNGVEQAGEHFATGLDALADRLDTEHGHLVQDGFEKLGHELEESRTSLDQARQESEQAWTELAGEVHELQTQAQPSWDAADGALAEAATAAEAGGTSLETEGTTCVHDFDAAGGEIEGACTALDQELRTLYETCEGTIDSEFGELVEALHDLAGGAVKLVEEGSQEQLEAPAALVETEGLDTLAGEYSLVEAWLGIAEAIAGAVDPLTEELVKSQAVVAEVDQLMNALAG